MDAARTARRLGAEPLIIYRRTREQMPAHAFEADEAIEEGVKIHWLRTIKQIDGTTFTVEVMKLDDHGFPQPTGEFETLEADSLILALGQDTDTAFLKKVPGIAFTGTAPSSSAPTCRPAAKAFLPAATWCRSTRTVTTAIGHGKKAARTIDAWLRGDARRTRSRSTNRHVRDAASLVSRRGQAARAKHDRHRAPARDVRRGHRRAGRRRGAV